MEIGDKSVDVIVMTLEDGERVMMWSVCMCLCVIMLGEIERKREKECCGKEEFMKKWLYLVESMYTCKGKCKFARL